ncbi:MAG: amino acid-binding protein [Actinobacteria bacterium]|nr:amino acid-binding protein [Actinomycetota bacterium]
MSRFSLTAIGTDRPGIVAALTKPLAGLGYSIEDSAMAILQGNFAIMLVMSTPENVQSDSVENTLAKAAQDMNLIVAVRPVETTPSETLATGKGEGDILSVSVYGADHPGIVYGVTSTLASFGANIVELRTHVTKDSEDNKNSLYIMIIEVTLPPKIDRENLDNALSELSEELGVSISTCLKEEQSF